MKTDQLETPIGVLGVAATRCGLARVLLPRVLGGSSARLDPGDSPDEPAAAHLAAAKRQITEYFAGQRTTFELTIDWAGVEGLRLDVLRALEAGVPFGRTTTYGELANAAGAPGAAQVVGQIMGSNPVPVVVGCHRVLAADGLGGFGGGLRTKEWLLAWEGVLTQPLDLR
jgi:methylated-DNA-[protein]-cysteine S-methyltransferase